MKDSEQYHGLSHLLLFEPDESTLHNEASQQSKVLGHVGIQVLIHTLQRPLQGLVSHEEVQHLGNHFLASLEADPHHVRRQFLSEDVVLQ